MVISSESVVSSDTPTQEGVPGGTHTACLKLNTTCTRSQCASSKWTHRAGVLKVGNTVGSTHRYMMSTTDESKQHTRPTNT